MAKLVWKPGTMLYPVPAVLVTSRYGKSINVATLSWVGTICTEPPMVSISLRPERFSYGLIKKSGEFVINLPGQDLAFAVDFCGVRSGMDIDKFAECKLRIENASIVKAPLIKQCPVAIEARVNRVIELGSHHMFLAQVLAVNVEDNLIDRGGRFHLERAGLLCYNHGHYCAASRPIGKFGFSIQKRKKKPGIKQVR